ncbi:mechanosensitive ion channel family protein [Bdellovibrio sp. ArHS]|uniref:mechanosensitive ion channel family protein n=1 Tax=Bdellovibrio sp. ArHS TaxID=1569284 RepID=UPI0025C48D1B|nr:mechanosensitive ion channel family protein [Bdellovibrio sp. ArHS]
MRHDLEVITATGGPWPWFFALIGAVLGTLIIKAILKGVAPRLKYITAKTSRQLDDTIATCLTATKSWFIFTWIFVPLLHAMSADTRVLAVGKALVVFATASQLGIWGLYAIQLWKNNYLKKKTGTNASTASAMGIITTVLQGTLIIALVLISLSNLGVNIGALLAGLGVGGIAVALAAQNILGDMFASLSIVLDKPFEVGDFITVGPQMGTVENIGIKTTRVRSLSGEELVFSNRDLLDSRIQNFKRMWKRRVALRFSVPHTTPLPIIRQIPSWISEIVKQQKDIELERSHLDALGSSSVEFEFVYWVQNPDFTAHMDIKQNILWSIQERLHSQKVRLALPGQSLYIESLPTEVQKSESEETSRQKKNLEGPLLDH